MRKYSKPRRSERKGHRPSNVSLPAGISLTDLEKAGKKILEILVDSRIPTEKDFGLLEQARLACKSVRAHQAKKDYLLLSQLEKGLNRHEEFLHRLGVSQPEILKLNLWISRVLIKEQEGIEKLLKEITQKIATAEAKNYQ